MFIGAINQDLRRVIAGMAPAWKGLPIYVGCSGNMTIERILANEGFTDLHSNDVSIYSCALGAFLSGKTFRIKVRDERLAWLGEYLQPGLATVACLLSCTTALEFWDRDTPYHKRMWNAYLRRWPAMHKQTVAKLEAALLGLRLKSYFAGDVVDFLTDAPERSVVISFPPTYKSGYERLYRKLQAVFEWDTPVYQVFDKDRFQVLIEAMQTKAHWLVSRDEPIESLAAHQVAKVQTSLRSKPVSVYANQAYSVLTLPRQKVEPIPHPRLSGTPRSPLQLINITDGQINALRSQYLSAKIVPGATGWRWGVLAGGELIGAFAFSQNQGPIAFVSDIYMITDLAIDSEVPRLSKLVLAAVLSLETQSLLEQKLAMRVRTIATTAFTRKPASMKYRGLFEIHSRKEDKINYVGQAGRWSLEEGLQWWLKTQCTRQPIAE